MSMFSSSFTLKSIWFTASVFAAVSCCFSSMICAQEEEVTEETSEVSDPTLDGPSESTSSDVAAPATPEVALPEPVTPPTETTAEPAQPPATEEQKTVENPEEKVEENPSQTADASEEDKTEEKSAETQQVEVPPMQTVDATPAAASGSDLEDQLQHERMYGNRLFGRSRIQIAVNRPTFNEGQKDYEIFYGKPKDYLSIGGDWFPLDWWVNPGLSLKMSGYSVSGLAGKQNTDGTVSPDENSKTNLLFIPIQGAFKVELTPFRKKWLVLDGWVGYEYGWWQETTANSASISAWRMATDTTTTKSTDTSKLTSKGVKSSTTFGLAANILLNALDQRSVRSMVSTMGISHVYLSPYFESVRTINKTGLTFGRNVYGIGFTFETIK